MDVRNSSELVRTFVDDHKVLMRSLTDIRKRLRANDYEAAKERADKLDQTIGPHIRFEEEVLYPAVAKTYGSQFEGELREEHSTVSNALKQLLRMRPASSVSAEQMGALEEAFETATEHAGSCGSLVSHLHRLPPEEQRQALTRLTRFREQGIRWTALANRLT